MSLETAMTVATRTRAAMATLAIGALLFLAASGIAAAAETVKIEISGYSLVPSEVTVAPGTTVVWVNHDQVPLTFISTDHLFVSKAMDTDDQYSFTFDKEGDFGYVCSLHPYMAGIVKVRQP
jgi:plastocyanin